MKNIIEEIKKDTLRDSFIEQLTKLEEDKLMSIPDEYIDLLLFNIMDDKKVMVINDEIAKKIDFSNVSFKDVFVKGTDFTNMHNVRINPQDVFNKDMSDTILSGVVFTGPFDDVYIAGANFKDSFNAIINPQVVYNKDLSNTDLSSTIFISDMKDVITDNMTFDDILEVGKDSLTEDVLNLLRSENLLITK